MMKICGWTLRDVFRMYASSLFAGICISIGCTVNLMVGGGITGACLFTFGLIAVVHYGYKLYTGTAGFIHSWGDFLMVFGYILVGNFFGCWLMADLMSVSLPGISEAAYHIAQSRTFVTWPQALIRGIFCGFLMTTAVKFARVDKWLPLLFAVPVFILAGFYHSIADAFYLLCANHFKPVDFMACNYLVIVLGNFIGCNIHRIVEKI